MKKLSFSVHIFNEFKRRSLVRALVIEALTKSLLENKEEVRILSSNNGEIGVKKYLRRTMRSQKIRTLLNFGRFEFRKNLWPK